MKKDMQRQVNIKPEMQKELNKLKELVKKQVNMKFVEDDQVIDVKFMNETNGLTIKVDT